MFQDLAVVVAALAAAFPPAQAGAGLHKDEELGFQMEVPKDWRAVPLAASEKWVVAKYISNRELQSKKEWWSGHTPEMRVILFPTEVTKERGPKVTKVKDGPTLVKFRSPFSDYKSYLKQNAEGGYYVAKEEPTTVNNIEATCLEIRFEKLTVPRHAVAWVFKGEDAEWAVHFEALEDYWEKLAPDFTRCLRTFKFIPRKGSVTARAGDNDLDFDSIFEVGKTSIAERATKRAALFERELQTAVDRLPAGWIRKKSPHFYAFSHSDERHTARVLEQAEALVAWLTQNFSWVGDGLPGPAILRICKGWEEFRAFHDTSNDAMFVRSFEVVAYKDTEGYGFGSWGVNGAVANLWFADKNPRLRWGMPPWLNTGISAIFGGSSAKGGKVEFKLDEWEREALRQIRQKGKLVTARQLLGADYDELRKFENSWLQCGLFLRYLWTGPKSASTKDLFKKYVQAYLAVVEEEEKAEEAAGKKENKPKTEEEEEARFKARRQETKRQADKVFQRIFGSWSEADWAAFERGYADFAD
ncbi:MAG TPA: hypothetical protein VFI25_01980 [Planctomycetota bacterium]|jgi:hypothetical protein|nr:hypothetical protein [Planctomycetota bacterium]